MRQQGNIDTAPKEYYVVMQFKAEGQNILPQEFQKLLEEP